MGRQHGSASSRFRTVAPFPLATTTYVVYPALNGATCALGNFPQCLTHHARVRLSLRAHCSRQIGPCGRSLTPSSLHPRVASMSVNGKRRVRRPEPYVCGKRTPFQPGDEQTGDWSRERLVARDRRFCARVERAFKNSTDSRNAWCERVSTALEMAHARAHRFRARPPCPRPDRLARARTARQALQPDARKCCCSPMALPSRS